MRVLIVDPSKRTAQVLKRYLLKGLGAVEVRAHRPATEDPPADLDWSYHDAVLLAQDLGEGTSGLSWLRALRSRPGFPPAILLAANLDATLTAQGVKAGAHRVVSKRNLTPENLAEMVTEALQSRAREEAASSFDEAASSEAERLLQELREDHAASGDRPNADYRYVRLIGQGAMSRVYLAERLDDDTTVVLKILDGELAQDVETVQRFVQEAALIAELDSPYVVKIYEQGFTNRYGFIAMEFFSRGDLKQRIDNGISTADARAYAVQIGSALEAIHEAGIVHRDLKPANIMFRADDSLALADFGISKRIGGTMDLTMTGSVLGTAHYMSPEQGRAGPVDTRADLYSAGIILYEMLVGERPFDGDSASGIIYQHLNADIPRLPAEIEQFQTVVDRLLAKDPDERYQRGSELVEALSAISIPA